MAKKIYLAGPYSNRENLDDDLIPSIRHEHLTDIAGYLFTCGYWVYSPITHSRPLAMLHDLPHTFEFWKGLDESHIDWCDEVWCVAMHGWKESIGVQHEIRYAKKTGKKVRLIAMSNVLPVEFDGIRYDLTSGKVILTRELDVLDGALVMHNVWNVVSDEEIDE